MVPLAGMVMSCNDKGSCAYTGVSGYADLSAHVDNLVKPQLGCRFAMDMCRCAMLQVLAGRPAQLLARVTDMCSVI